MRSPEDNGYHLCHGPLSKPYFKKKSRASRLDEQGERGKKEKLEQTGESQENVLKSLMLGFARTKKRYSNDQVRSGLAGSRLAGEYKEKCKQLRHALSPKTIPKKALLRFKADLMKVRAGEMEIPKRALKPPTQRLIRDRRGLENRSGAREVRGINGERG